MTEIEILNTGILYRNPKPHVHSVHAYFPSVVRLSSGELLASVVLGEAFEAANLTPCICRSYDGGETWSLEGEICPRLPGHLTSAGARLTALPNGDVVAFLVRSDRSGHPEEGLTNPETLGPPSRRGPASIEVSVFDSACPWRAAMRSRRSGVPRPVSSTSRSP